MINNFCRYAGLIFCSLDYFQSGESKKKKLKKDLFKPPTAEEMTHLRETENLFHSNLFRLEVGLQIFFLYL